MGKVVIKIIQISLIELTKKAVSQKYLLHAPPSVHPMKVCIVIPTKW
jgi:hypothetical protein